MRGVQSICRNTRLFNEFILTASNIMIITVHRSLTYHSDFPATRLTDLFDLHMRVQFTCYRSYGNQCKQLARGADNRNNMYGSLSMIGCLSCLHIIGYPSGPMVLLLWVVYGLVPQTKLEGLIRRPCTKPVIK